MHTEEAAHPAPTRPLPGQRPNGAAMAAFLAAGMGAFAVGFIVLLHEAGVFSAPPIYGPAGGVSGRTTLAVMIWLISWAVLHGLWKDRDMSGGRIGAITLVLTALGILGTFPPVWTVFK